MLILDQPNPGERVLHCGHRDAEGQIHFYRAQLVFTFKRPNGTEGNCQWIICCDRCFKDTGGDGGKVKLRMEAVWDGSVPRICVDGIGGLNGNQKEKT